MISPDITKTKLVQVELQENNLKLNDYWYSADILGLRELHQEDRVFYDVERSTTNDLATMAPYNSALIEVQLVSSPFMMNHDRTVYALF